MRRARAGKGDEELLKLKLFLPFPFPAPSSHSRVVWSRSCGRLLGSEAVVVEVDQEQLSQVEQTGLPVSWWSAPSMRNCATPGSKRHQDYSLQPALLNFLDSPQTHFIVTNPAYIPNIAKGTTDPRVEFISQDHNAQFTKLEHITISESRLSNNFKISTKHQHLD